MACVPFYSLAAVTLVSAVLVVTLRNALHSALFLGLALAGVAGIFASLGADFLFASQILVYVSGVAVLVVFVVMLAGRQSELHMRQTNKQWLVALLPCGGLLAGMMTVYRDLFGHRLAAEAAPTTAKLGSMLIGRGLDDKIFGAYAAPFELISIILIGALIGAVIFTKAEGGKR